LNWVNKEDLQRKRNFKEIDWFKWIKQGKAEWKIIWWCIPSINHLIWTDYWINLEENIFFIDLPEGHEIWKGISISDLDSYLTDLDNIWTFDKINWLLISIPYWYNEDEKNHLEELLLKFIESKNYPVWINFPIWHTDPMITIPLLSNIKINSLDNSFILNY
jgi:muramoyltetrapeptide carboxypeptidase LdcA involved in peptidoglycan recycling